MVIPNKWGNRSSMSLLKPPVPIVFCYAISIRQGPTLLLRLNYEIGPRRKGDVIAIYANNDLAKTKLGWEPKFSLDEMMKTAWEWEQRLKADDTIFTGIPAELN